MALPRVVGRYTLHQEIATGGMATVYLARMVAPARFSPVVAVKAMHPHFAREPEFVRMFLDEARLAARIRHPNVVPVLDVHEEGDLFLVLEYIHGESLARLLTSARDDGRPVPLAIASAIACDVLRGLHAAHEARDENGRPLGVVHRDVSPHNVLVGVDGVARVFDFGIARAAGRLTMTREGQIKGKLGYMAPEQLRGGTVTRQADVFSAGIVLWQMLTGERLFAGDAEANVIEQALFRPIPAPSQSRDSLPEGLDAVVLRALSRDPAQRFASANEMALELQRIVPPASPQEIGAWVEGAAFDVLEERARAIAAIEAIPAATSTPRRGRHVRLAAALALVVLAASGIWLGVRSRSGPQSVSIASEPAAPSVAAAVDSSAETTPEPPAPQETASQPASTAKPVALHPRPTTIKRSSAPATAPASTGRCARRGPDGIIEFDTQCLRQAQGAP
ncbi:MAG TPA: protein kinase [Polyangiaceae bacterium]